MQVKSFWSVKIPPKTGKGQGVSPAHKEMSKMRPCGWGKFKRISLATQF